MSTNSRQRSTKRPTRVRGGLPGDKPAIPGPYTHVIPQKVYGLTTAAASKVNGAFGGVSKIERARRRAEKAAAEASVPVAQKAA